MDLFPCERAEPLHGAGVDQKKVQWSFFPANAPCHCTVPGWISEARQVKSNKPCTISVQGFLDENTYLKPKAIFGDMGQARQGFSMCPCLGAA
ncbi:MAG: hypothetical protein WBA92_09110 [Pseudorhodobacter sp.]